VRPQCYSAKSSKNFLSPDQNWANFGGFGGLGSAVLKSFDFYSKRHMIVCVNPRRLSHFASKSVEGVTSRSVRGKK